MSTASENFVKAQQQGIALMEVLVALFVFSIVGLGLAQSTIVGLRAHMRAEVGNFARNLAVSKAEELSGVKISDLDETYDETESDLTVSGSKVKFTRVTNVIVNSDNSRTIEITVSSSSIFLPVPIFYKTRFAPWE